MEKRIYIEPETLKTAEENTRTAISNARIIIENGTPDEIRAAVADVLQKSQAYRALNMCKLSSELKGAATMEEYTKAIDKYIEYMKTEYNSCHEILTKVLNYEYMTGQLYAEITRAQDIMTTDAFTELYLYRKEERDDIETLFNQDYITPLYSIFRKSPLSRSCMPQN